MLEGGYKREAQVGEAAAVDNQHRDGLHSELLTVGQVDALQ